MSKVGIITIYDLLNFGNRLQNYAVKKILEDRGHVVDTIIFSNKVVTPGKLLKKIKKEKISLHWNEMQEDPAYVESLNYVNQMKYSKFKEFSDKYTSIVHLDYKNSNAALRNKYDKFVAGSDQIWNCKIGQGTNWEFLTFAKDEQKVTIAPSFGGSEIPKEHVERFKNNLAAIPYISVREEAGAKIVKDLTGKDAEVLIDPTMMLTSNEWDEIAKKPENVDTDKPYILTYFLGGTPSRAKKDIEELAGDMKVYPLLDEGNPEIFVSGPDEFIYLLSHAKLVLTDSFHACVFSILYNKPFLVYKREGKEPNMMSRIETLLKKFDLERKYVESGLNNDVYENDYTKSYKRLEKEREKMVEFLNKSGV